MNNIIRPLSYQQRIDTLLILTKNLTISLQEGNLQGNMLEIALRDIDETAKDLSDNLLKKDTPSDKKNEFIKKFKKSYEEKNIKDIESFFELLYNQILVVIYTFVDDYLIDSLEIIINEKPEILIQMSNNEKDITVKDVIESSTYSDVLKKIKTKVTDKFGRKGIDKKLKDFQQLGINLDNLNYEELEEEINKRHDIVHKDERPIKSLEELVIIGKKFSNFIIQLAIKFHKHFNVHIDFESIVDNPENLKYDL